MGVFCMFFFIFFVKRPDGLRAGVILAVQDTGGIFCQILADSAEALLRPGFNFLVKSFSLFILLLFKGLFLGLSMCDDG